MKKIKNLIKFILILSIISSNFHIVNAQYDLDKVIEDTAKNLMDENTKPAPASLGGEWLVLALARSGLEIEQKYFDIYYDNLCKTLVEKNGVLHDKKYSEYSRAVLALTAIAKETKDVAGFNLLAKLGDFEKVNLQGANGSVFALLALDSGNYEIEYEEDVKIKASRQMYIEKIISRQLVDGGFSLAGESSDVDFTAMAIQALAKYTADIEVDSSVDSALDFLSKAQNEDGGFKHYGVENLESTAQVLMSLSELGIDISDKRFVKNEKTVIDALMQFYQTKGVFSHDLENLGSATMASEQALYSLVNYQRVSSGKSSLYRIKEKNLEEAEISFSDIKGHKYEKSILELANKKVVSGFRDATFRPDDALTRAEFVTIICKAFKLESGYIDAFDDVDKDDWFAVSVSTVSYYGIVEGVSERTFLPQKNISKEEASAVLCKIMLFNGYEFDLSELEIDGILESFDEEISVWARASLAFCLKHELIDIRENKIFAKENMTRAEASEAILRIMNKLI